MRSYLFAVLLTICALSVDGRHRFKTFEINLDLPAEQRYQEVATYFN